MNDPCTYEIFCNVKYSRGPGKPRHLYHLRLVSRAGFSYLPDFAFVPSAETFARRMRLRMSGLAVDSFMPDPPDRSPPRLPPRPPRRAPPLPPRPFISSFAWSIFFKFIVDLNRWFGPGDLSSPSFFGTRRICPFTPFICAQMVVPVLPIIKLSILFCPSTHKCSRLSPVKS